MQLHPAGIGWLQRVIPPVDSWLVLRQDERRSAERLEPRVRDWAHIRIFLWSAHPVGSLQKLAGIADVLSGKATPSQNASIDRKAIMAMDRKNTPDRHGGRSGLLHRLSLYSASTRMPRGREPSEDATGTAANRIVLRTQQ